MVGVCVYLLDRDWGSTMFLGALARWQPVRHAAFGTLGGFLPSFLHAYAFTVLLIVALWPWWRRGVRAWVALGWFAVAAALEMLQAPAVALAAFGPPDAATGTFLIRRVALYAARGEFDWADLRATALGCITAWLIATSVERSPS